MEYKTERQKIELKKAKRLALSLLLLATATFFTTLFLPANFWVLAGKAVSEAAMIGAMADWFAVHALFRPVRLPFIGRHTAIIPRNKEKIAVNLGVFIQEKFLDTQSLISLIRRHQPVQLLAVWLNKSENAYLLGKYLLNIMGTFLDLTDDAQIQKLLRRGVHKAIDNLDLSHSGAILLESMTKHHRHQVLLDALIGQVLGLLKKPSSRAFIAGQITAWLNSEHPRKAKLLPTEWLGEQSAEWVSDAVNRLLDDITHDKQHQIRQGFDRAVQRFITELKSSPDMMAKAESIKRYLKDDEAFNRYIGELWNDLRRWLKTDSASGDSQVQQRIALAGQWFGETLLSDKALQVSLNEHLELAVRRMTPDFAAFITRHISDTVNSWDSKELADHIEFNIGKDLQFIRINGTLVGGMIGLVLYLLSQLPGLMESWGLSLSW
ncbi:DUF445 family protein [uncultured Cedecea sp.]|uniref:DUF445 domain-containing protein n=1 Tax=uncultured Cedecea sp. TaxID=988762 RepID=UPI00261D68AC|nr:DUF445 family protein [uncultured Cedecea sp.]